MDNDEHCWLYRGYLLMCEGERRLIGGGYRAVVAVAPYDDLDSAEIADSPGEVLLISEEDAVAFGRAWATARVDKILGPPSLD